MALFVPGSAWRKRSTFFSQESWGPSFHELTIGDEDIVHHISVDKLIISTGLGGMRIRAGRLDGATTYTWPAAAIFAKVLLRARSLSFCKRTLPERNSSTCPRKVYTMLKSRPKDRHKSRSPALERQ